MVYLTKRFHFAASHRLFKPGLSNEENLPDIIYDFEINLLKLLGFHNIQNSDTTEKIDTQMLIEDLLERKLKTRQILPQLS